MDHEEFWRWYSRASYARRMYGPWWRRVLRRLQGLPIPSERYMRSIDKLDIK